VTVLGPVTIDGVAVTRRQQIVLAALASFGDDGAGTDRLIEAVWPDAIPRSARASLQNQVARLRAGFGADAIETIDDGYRLRRSTDAE
jgi:DNA-binding SARP family transcriptional activator